MQIIRAKFKERERANKEMTETVREFRIHIEKELNELRHFVNAESERNKFSVSENESETRKIDDKIKQIIQRVKENEIHQREKHNKHKQNFESLNDKVSLFFNKKSVFQEENFLRSKATLMQLERL